MALLEVNGLSTTFHTEGGLVHAVDDVSFSVEQGRTIGIVGESGCGKSVTMLTIMGLNNRKLTTSAGEVHFEGRDLMQMRQSQLRLIRGDGIAMIFQDPMTSLNPVHSVRTQLIEAIRTHRDVSEREARDRAVSALTEVGIPNADRRIDDYPHQFSGGMRQRVMIAMAMINEPRVLIADEPTTALDVTTQAQILRLMKRLQEVHGTAIIIITHDLGVVAETADEVAVMYAGRIVEKGPVDAIFKRPQHPYTWGLLGSLPRLDTDAERLAQIPGQPPSLLNPPAGCRFHPRCAFALERCGDSSPKLLPVHHEPAHTQACFLDPETKRREIDSLASESASTPVLAPPPVAGAPRPRSGARPAEPALQGDELVVVDGLRKHFPVTKRLLSRKDEAAVKAVDGVSFSVRRGETLGIVGESGCGKSTLARCIMRLLEPTDGRVIFDERDITRSTRQDLRPVRREMTMVFQDPYASLNPKKRVGFIVGEPLEVHRWGTEAAIKQRVQDLLEVVGLNPEHYRRFPHEFSGGQRQRIGVARALAVNPKLIICDEPVSALDVSVQAQILNLLRDLQRDFNLTYIFIAHDLRVVRHISDRVMVMYLGKLAEVAGANDLYREPRHPYTGSLLSAVPIVDPELGRQRQGIPLEGDVPSPLNPPDACRFHPRCPRAKTGVCDVHGPELLSYGDLHRAACHFPLERWPMTAEEMGRRSTEAPTSHP